MSMTNKQKYGLIKNIKTRINKLSKKYLKLSEEINKKNKNLLFEKEKYSFPENNFCLFSSGNSDTYINIKYSENNTQIKFFLLNQSQKEQTVPNDDLTFLDGFEQELQTIYFGN